MKILSNYLTYYSKKVPNKDYVIVDGNKYSYKDTEIYVNKLITKLKRLNKRKGDILSLILPNCYEYILFFHACTRLGIIFNPYPDNLISNDLLKYIKFVNSNIIICEKKRYFELKSKIKKKIIYIDENFIEDLKREKETFVNSKISKNNISCLYYSSGSTSNPKSILYSHENIIYLTNSINKNFNFNSNTKHLIVLPLGHTASINYSFLPSTIAGGTIFLLKNIFGENRKLFWRIIKQNKINFVELVPSLVVAILNTIYKKVEYNKIDSLKFIGCGSSVLPKQVQKKFIKKFNIKLLNLYGLSETGPTHYEKPNKKKWSPGSIGLPLDVNKVTIFDENFKECKIGIKGEIAIKGKNVFPGYFKNSTLTRKAFYQNWFLTGDIGYKDKNGFFHYVGRKKEIIIKSGINISPDEIDEVIYKLQNIEQVLTIGVTNKVFGESIVSYVVLKKNKKIDKDEIINFCRKYLSLIKVPDKIVIVKKLPKTNSGKFSRKLLLNNINN